jgi:hypothetical protein
MTPNLPDYLAECFAADARLLRDRCTTLGNSRQPSPGPNVAACRAMADACDRVSALFATAAGQDDRAVQALLPTLDQMEAGERDPQARHVYAGAIRRVESLLKRGDDDEHDDDDDEDEDEDEDDD